MDNSFNRKEDFYNGNGSGAGNGSSASGAGGGNGSGPELFNQPMPQYQNVSAQSGQQFDNQQGQPLPQMATPNQTLPNIQPMASLQPTGQNLAGAVSQEPPQHGGNIKPRGPWMIIAIIFIVLTLILGGAFGWAFMRYIDYRDNTNYKISLAVAEENKTVSAKMQQKFEEERSLPDSLFVGPDDYGRVSFKYPKNWSVFVASEISSGTNKPFNAYFHPDVVPPISDTQQFALRMSIEDVDYDKAVNRYESQVKKGELKSSPIQVGSLNGTRLDGFFSEDIRGAAVLFKVRDKTLILRTDSNAFMAYFDALIKTIQVNE